MGVAEPEKAQVKVEGADQRYREVRIENALQDAQGHPVSRKKDADVEISIKADPESVKKNPKPTL